MIKYLKLSFLMVFFSGTLLAQQTSVYTHELTEFNRAVELYKDKQYQAAQILFDKVKSKTDNMEVESDCAYYIAKCAIRFDQMGADVLVESYVEDYPTSTKTNQAYIEDLCYEPGYLMRAKSANVLVTEASNDTLYIVAAICFCFSAYLL